MELKSSISLLVVQEYGTVAPLNSHRWWCDGGFNGWSEATDSHGPYGSGVNSSRLLTEKVGRNYLSPAGDVPKGEASGLVPEGLHQPWCSTLVVYWVE